MDFELPPDAVMLRDILVRFIEKEARPVEMKYLHTGFLEPEEQARFQSLIEQMGLWGITVPEKFGGGGLDLVTTCVLEEELGKTFIPLRIGDVPPLLYTCREGQVKRYLEPALAGQRTAYIAACEPDAVHPQEWQTSAISTNGGYQITGNKLLTGVPSNNDFLVVFTNDSNGISAFLVDANQRGVEFKSDNKVLLSLKTCKVGGDALLGGLGQGLSLGHEESPRSVIRLSARYVGIACRLLDLAIEYARDKVTLGAPLSTYPAIQEMLAEIKVLTEGARWSVYHAAWQGDRGEAIASEAAQVHLFCGEMIQKSIDLITMVYGGPGPLPRTEFQRIVQCLLPPEIFSLGLESARLLVAGELLGVSPRS